MKVLFSLYIMHHKCLRLTNILLMFSVIYFCVFSQKTSRDYIFAFLLALTITMSQIFWQNPGCGSIIHKIDAFIAKVVIITFIIYTLTYKLHTKVLLVSYFFILIGICISFYYSTYYSKHKWCSENHVRFHALLHILCFIATLYAF
jgi:hypothetical protein